MSATTWVRPVGVDDTRWMAACERIEHLAFGHARLSLASELRQPHAAVWAAGVTEDGVAPEASEPLAFVLVWYLADEVEIQTVATAPAARRRGLGRALVAHALDAARERRCQRALLEVRAGNEAARGLYRALGFQDDGVRRRYYDDPVEDAVLMSRSLETP